jgi:hypothetical protein
MYEQGGSHHRVGSHSDAESEVGGSRPGSRNTNTNSNVASGHGQLSKELSRPSLIPLTSNNGSTNYAASSHAVTGSSTFAASTPTHASSGGTTSGIGISMSNNSGSNVGGSGTGSTRGSSRSPKPAVVRLPGVPDQHAPNSPYS